MSSVTVADAPTHEPEPPVGQWGYRPHLDGLRTIAVYLVIAFHATVDRLSGGFIGVDVFFVLSGYLVTNILVRDLDRHGRVPFGTFYSRRVRRLLPAALVNLVVTAVVFAVVAAPAELQTARRGIAAAALYVANWFFIRESADYFAADVTASPVVHYWSLSVEEQFYLLWPLLLGGLFVLWRRFGRGSRAGLRATVMGLAAASLAWALVLARTDLDRAYYGTDARAYQLLAGAALALSPGVVTWLRGRGWERPLRVVSVGLLAALGLVATWWLDVGPITRGAITAAVVVALLLALEATSGGPVRWLLSTPPMTYLGKISYGTYLWHWLVIVVAERTVDLGSPATAALAAVVGTGIASLSYQLLEMPIRVTPTLDRYRRVVVAVGLCASLIVALLVVPPILSGSEPTSAAQGDVSSGTPVEVDWTTAKSGFFDYDRCPPGQGKACRIVAGDGPRVLVVGESHAAMYTPMLEEIARDRGLDLWVGFLNYCPWTHGIRYAGIGSTCLTEQDTMYGETIPDLQPDLVVLSHRSVDDPNDRLVIGNANGPVPEADRPEALAEAVRRSVAEIRETGASVLAFEPVPVALHGTDPLACLSQAEFLEECRFVTTTQPLGEELTMRELADGGTMWTIDVDRVACPYLPICDPVVDGQIVRMDQNHLTPAFVAAEMRGPVERFLDDNSVLG